MSENVATCQRFLTDFGLIVEQNNHHHFHTLNGAQVQLYPIDDPQLPAAFESGSTLRRITWGVDNQATLARLAQQLSAIPSLQTNEQSIEINDPNGMRLRFEVTQTKEVAIDVIPMNQWGAIQRIDRGRLQIARSSNRARPGS